MCLKDYCFMSALVFICARIVCMGSGKGKTRRSQASSVDVPVRATGRWQAFAVQQGLVGMRLQNYYQKELKSVDDVVVVAQEILRDLVATGSVVLPSGATVDGLEVRKQTGYKGQGWLPRSDEIGRAH